MCHLSRPLKEAIRVCASRVSCALEHAISDLDAEIDRLNRAIREKGGTEGHLEPADERLSQLTRRGEDLLDHWAETDRRYAQAVKEMEARVGEWNTIEARLRQESLERMRSFEQTIAREWKELRDVHTEPLKQLRDQATALGETSVAAANLALRGYERAEARLAALEADLRGQLSQLSREVHAALAEIRRERTLGPAPATAPFQLDSVMRLHEELRQDGPSSSMPAEPALSMPAEPAPSVPAKPAPAPVPVMAASAASPTASTPLPVSTPSSSIRQQPVPREMFAPKPEPARSPSVRIVYPRRAWRIVPALVVIAIVVAGYVGFQGLQRANAGLGEPTAQAAGAARPAPVPQAPSVAPASAPAARADQPAAAVPSPPREPESMAALAADVITATDVIRFPLRGVGLGLGASGQALWSRSRGIVLTASGVPTAAPGSVYRVWLMSDTQSVRVSEIEPDETGRARLAAKNPAVLPGLVDNLVITAEPAGAPGATPSGAAILRRASQ